MKMTQTVSVPVGLIGGRKLMSWEGKEEVMSCVEGTLFLELLRFGCPRSSAQPAVMFVFFNRLGSRLH